MQVPFMTDKSTCGSHLVLEYESKNIPSQDFMVMNIFCINSCSGVYNNISHAKLTSSKWLYEDYF